MAIRPGISNRESADEEAREREAFPPLQERAQPVEDVGGRSEDPADLSRDAAREARATAPKDHQSSQKAGMRSLSQKESDRRHPDRPAPSTRKVAGAFGKEAPKRRNGQS